MRWFVIQEHHARSHHFDLRLERDGVLVSWAIPKGMPTDSKKNRLATRVEAHTLSQLDFENGAPVESVPGEGVPGAMRVRIWDRGTFEAEEFDEEKIIVILKDESLHDRYAIFRPGKCWLVHLMDPAEEKRS